MQKFDLDIVIPSLNRRQKLDTCLNSLFRADNLENVTIWLYLSDPVEYQHYWSYFDALKDKVKVVLLPSYRVPSFWNGHLATMQADAMFCVNDDTEFHTNAITNIISEFSTLYPDGDGVLGVTQSNALEGQGMEGAFPVIGRTFAERFPDRKVWCPDYYRLWADKELMDYARSVGKFHASTVCKIVHWHPAFGGTVDTTHIAVREFRDLDRKTYRSRQNKGLLWGQNWDLINKGDVCIPLVSLSLQGKEK